MAFSESKVLPVLRQSGNACHSHPKKIKGGLALERRAGRVVASGPPSITNNSRGGTWAATIASRMCVETS